MILVLCAFFTIAGCEKENQGVTDARKFYREMILQTNEYADKLGTVKDSQAAADILTKYIEKQKQLIEKGRDLRNKYPRLRLHDDPALKEYETALEDATRNFTDSVTEAMAKYLNKEEFRKALAKFDEIADESVK
jgi:hypothetical protein